MDATLTYKHNFSLFRCPRSPNKWTRPLVPSSLMERNVSVFILKWKKTPPCPHLAPPLSQCPHSLMGHTLALIPPLLYTVFCRQEEVFSLPCSNRQTRWTRCKNANLTRNFTFQDFFSTFPRKHFPTIGLSNINIDVNTEIIRELMQKKKKALKVLASLTFPTPLLRTPQVSEVKLFDGGQLNTALNRAGRETGCVKDASELILSA